MNLDGADVSRLTTGEGEAVNPAWHPDGAAHRIRLDARIRAGQPTTFS